MTTDKPLSETHLNLYREIIESGQQYKLELAGYVRLTPEIIQSCTVGREEHERICKQSISDISDAEHKGMARGRQDTLRHVKEAINKRVDDDNNAYNQIIVDWNSENTPEKLQAEVDEIRVENEKLREEGRHETLVRVKEAIDKIKDYEPDELNRQWELGYEYALKDLAKELGLDGNKETKSGGSK